MNLEVINKDGLVVVDSRDVAVMVDKKHAHLLRDIKGYKDVLDQNPNLDSANFFIESTYKNENNQSYAHYFLTRKGCDMTANKMSGEKGILFTATYVTKFEEMEDRLRSQAPKLPTTYKEALLALVEEVEKNEKLETENLMLNQQVKESKPKVTYYDEILKSKGTITITQIAKDYGLTPQKLNKILHEEKVQYKKSKQWLLYDKHADKGYTKSETHLDANGEARMNTKWTQKGRLFIHGILQSKGIEALSDKED